MTGRRSDPPWAASMAWFMAMLSLVFAAILMTHGRAISAVLNGVASLLWVAYATTSHRHAA